jgi:membrane protein DedA with SNARE-associated domain
LRNLILAVFSGLGQSLAWVGGWLLSAAQQVQGPGILLVAVADSSFLSFPEGNDLLIVVLSTGSTWSRMAYYVVMTIVGSVCGCVLLYTVGLRGGRPLLSKRFSAESIVKAERLFEKYGMLTVAVPCLLPPPCPFKIFVLSAGVFRLKLSEFLTAVIVGRSVRYFTWGILAVLYGNSVKAFIQNNLTRVGTVLFALFLLAGAGILGFYWRRARQQSRKAGTMQS